MLDPVKIPKAKKAVAKPEIDLDTGDINYNPQPQLTETEGEGKPRKNDTAEMINYLKSKWAFRYNVLRNEVEMQNLETGKWKQLGDYQLNSIVVKARLDGYKTSISNVKMLLESEIIDEYHPIQHYFDNLPAWDGKDHIAAYCKRLVLTNPAYQPHLTPLVRRWLLAAAACALNITTRNEVCLVLIGGQGHGKTTWLDNICPRVLSEYRITGPIIPSKTDQSTANILAEMWFANIDDQLENLFGKDANALKNIITSDDVTNRKAYARTAVNRKRVASFMASVNSSNFLTDTSNRRYLCFEVATIDKTQPLTDSGPLWAQVKHLLQTGERVKFAAEEIAQINVMNLDFAEITPEMELVQKYLRPGKPDETHTQYATNTDILRFLNNKTAGTFRLNTKVLGRALTRLQFEQVSRRINGMPLKVYALQTTHTGDGDAFRNPEYETKAPF